MKVSPVHDLQSNATVFVFDYLKKLSPNFDSGDFSLIFSAEAIGKTAKPSFLVYIHYPREILLATTRNNGRLMICYENRMVSGRWSIPSLSMTFRRTVLIV
jgi:hypothetical protein